MPSPYRERVFGSLLGRSAVVSSILLLSTLLGYFVLPKLQDERASDRTKLVAIVPLIFGVWRVDPTIVPIVPSPDQTALINEIYDETLARTYVNMQGQRVMLSLAYGSNQSRKYQLHKPEVCYVGQGFRLAEMRFSSVKVSDKEIPAMELVAVNGGRIEPIIYWMRIGDEIGRGWIDQNLIRAKYALKGKIPDGLLFRVSTISRGEHSADFDIQRQFISDLMRSIPSHQRDALLGNVKNLQPSL